MAEHSKIEWTDADGNFDNTLYQRSRVHWHQRVWYGRQKDLFTEKRPLERGRKFELLASKDIFPKIGVEDAVNLAEIMSKFPFDFVATIGNSRVLLDVSVKWQKRVATKEPVARALGFPLYILLVSPRDHKFFYFAPVKTGAKSVRVPIAIFRQIAEHYGDIEHGRLH